MKRVTVFSIVTILILCGSCKRSSPASKAGAVETVLVQGPVSAWRIPFDREGEGTIVCRYVITGEDDAREYPVDGDVLTLTTVDQDGVLTIVHSSAGSAQMSSSITFRIDHPPGAGVRTQGPHAIKVAAQERTVWKKTWESREPRKQVFAVELKAYLRPKRNGADR